MIPLVDVLLCITEAVKLLLEVVKQSPHVPDAYQTLGLIHEELGQIEQVSLLSSSFSFSSSFALEISNKIYINSYIGVKIFLNGGRFGP